MSFNAICKDKILANISAFTVINLRDKDTGLPSRCFSECVWVYLQRAGGASNNDPKI